jgi:ADP-ribose pyrophosphatase YjhB (NUDIX family)
MTGQFRCIIHGSFSKHYTEIVQAARMFQAAGITVLAPQLGGVAAEDHGFALFADEIGQDPRLIELLYLQQLKQLGNDGFSYFVNPAGYVGTSASYELGIAQLTNTRCFFSHALVDHPAYIRPGSVWSPTDLADYIYTNAALPLPTSKRNEQHIQKLWEDMIVPGSVVAAGAIIEHQPRRSTVDKEILLVKTHKWGNRYSIVGGKVRRNELLTDALLREVREETTLRGEVGAHICTFDQITNSGYYQASTQHIFVDNVVTVHSKQVTLNDEAQDFIWALPAEALASLDIEPNARATIELYETMRQDQCSVVG